MWAPVCKPQGSRGGLWLRLGEAPLAPQMGAVMGDLGPKSLFQPISCSSDILPGSWMGTLEAARPTSSALLNLHLSQGPSSGPRPPTTRPRTKDTNSSLPQLTCHQALPGPAPNCPGMHPTAGPVALTWVTAQSLAGCPASGSLLGIFCMGSRKDSSELQT